MKPYVALSRVVLCCLVLSYQEKSLVRRSRVLVWDDVVHIVWGISVCGVSRRETRLRRAYVAQAECLNYWGWKLSKRIHWCCSAVAELIRWDGMA